MVDAEAKAVHDVDARCQQHFGVDLRKEESEKTAKREHNAFVCSKAPEGWHLTTGHIFRISGEHWICLSPACDLVPGQGGARNSHFGGRLPFVAVKLFRKEGDRKFDVNSNLYVFLNLDSEVSTFCFNSQGKDSTVPTWRTFYAERGGRLDEGFTFKVSAMEANSIELVAKVHPAQVVAQLRYEYALNLLQKLGASMTRVGLDFGLMSRPLGSCFERCHWRRVHIRDVMIWNKGLCLQLSVSQNVDDNEVWT